MNEGLAGREFPPAEGSGSVWSWWDGLRYYRAGAGDRMLESTSETSGRPYRTERGSAGC